MEPEDAAKLAARLREADVGVHVSGGFPGARRRVVTAFPDHIPEATTPLKVYYAAEAFDEGEFRVGLLQHLEDADIGDIVAHQEGLSAVTLGKAELPNLVRVSGKSVGLEQIPLERIASGSRKTQLVVVPSLRVDALGAKAFGVSRSYFSKGVKAGNVTVNGLTVGKSGSAEAGDEVYAEGLGRFSITSVAGETRRGNLKVNIEIEKA